VLAGGGRVRFGRAILLDTSIREVNCGPWCDWGGETRKCSCLLAGCVTVVFCNLQCPVCLYFRTHDGLR
jgi:hypothetical protein